MDLSRRRLLAAAGAALVPGLSPAHAAEDLVIKPITSSARLNSRYARFANQGDIGRPTQPIQLEPTPGLRLLAFLPPNQREARVVVFSHGELSEPKVYDRLLAHWASHGFVVLAPIHDDSVIENGLRARRQGRSGVAWDLSSVINDADAWRARAKMCRAALDCVPTLERMSGIRMSTERPVIAGHSYGAYTAQLLLGARALAGDNSVLEEAEPRFYAGLLLSPQGRGIMGLTDGSWDTLQRPALVVTGNQDVDVTRQDPNTKLEPYALSPPGNKHLAWFQKIVPTLYSGQQVRLNTPEQVIFEDLLAVTTAFLTAYAVYDRDVFSELAGDYYTRATVQRVTMYYR